MKSICFLFFFHEMLRVMTFRLITALNVFCWFSHVVFSLFFLKKFLHFSGYFFPFSPRLV